jgi:hypothetical protein
MRNLIYQMRLQAKLSAAINVIKNKQSQKLPHLRSSMMRLPSSWKNLSHQDSTSSSGNKLIPIIILAVLAIPDIGMGSWTILKTLSGDSGYSLTDNEKLYVELAELANAIALNWIYMYPEGQLASE